MTKPTPAHKGESIRCWACGCLNMLTEVGHGYQKWEVGDYDPHRHARPAAAEVEGEGWARRDERRTVAAATKQLQRHIEVLEDKLDKYAELLAKAEADERERCAQVADAHGALRTAIAIRNKGEKP